MKKCSLWTGCLLLALLLSSELVKAESGEKSDVPSEYTVAAYIWPSCHDDPMGREVLWPDGTGEWEIIKKGNPRFPGHYQPKVPLWGYELDNDPKVMERWIDLATDHGVNTFIFDWYWFNNGPFLESCLNDGFLKAPNNRKMNFYIMWADHDVARNYWNVHRYKDDDSRLWNGAIDWPNFKIVVQRVIEQYFKQPNYYKIEGEPVFSVFSVDNLIKTFGSLEETSLDNASFYGRIFAKSGGISDPRNGALIKMFNLIDIGERAGSGIPNFLSVWEKSGFGEPEMHESFEPERITIKFPLPSNLDEENSDNLGYSSDKMQKNSDNDITDGDNQILSSDKNITRQQFAIIKYLNSNECIGAAKVAEMLGVKAARARQILSDMVASGLLVAEGANKNRTYHINR